MRGARTDGYGHTKLEVHHALSRVMASFGSFPFLRLRMNSAFRDRIDAAWWRFRCCSSSSSASRPRALGGASPGHWAARVSRGTALHGQQV